MLHAKFPRCLTRLELDSFDKKYVILIFLFSIIDGAGRGKSASRMIGNILRTKASVGVFDGFPGFGTN